MGNPYCDTDCGTTTYYNKVGWVTEELSETGTHTNTVY